MFAMIRKELLVLLRDRASLITLFVSPMLFITVMSLALSNSFDTLGSAPKMNISIVDQDGGIAAKNVVKALGGSDELKVTTGLSGDAADKRVRDGKDSFAVVIPAGFEKEVESGRKPHFSFVVDPSSSRQAVDPLQAAIRSAVLTVTSSTRTAVSLEKQRAAEHDPVRKAQLKKQIDKIDETWSGVTSTSTFPKGMTGVKYPSVYQQNVPGYTVMYVFFIVTVMAGSIMVERREGTFRRLLSAPVPRWQLLLGKVVPYLMVAVAQVGVLMAFGKLVFGMDLGVHPVALVPITVALGCCAVALGLLLASFAKSESQVNGMGTIVILVLAALGGCMVPGVFMPDFMQDIAGFTPHGKALNAFQEVMVKGADLGTVLPASGFLLGLAALFFVLAVPRFRFVK
ncbi:ABC transporter permease [Streptomyces huiliensis]|uniref:ABC transporter permease n=1 Tax=Streptomyces huiliensis TaxID=2876027 RepID=UPI001CBCB7CE|nr:ABC transporter permease [Streptomyces huiliensis]MBZ4319782.1 ABC transporter permease [Streptomyces huiliensis]